MAKPRLLQPKPEIVVPIDPTEPGAEDDAVPITLSPPTAPPETPPQTPPENSPPEPDLDGPLAEPIDDRSEPVPELLMVAIDDLDPAAYNPRTITPEAMAALQHGIATFGLVEPIVVNVDGGKPFRIVGGHQRVKACILLGRKSIPAMTVDLPRGGAKEKALNLALNKISGEWDLQLLGALLMDLRDGDEEIDMLLTGFGTDEIDTLIDALEDEPDPDAGPGGDDDDFEPPVGATITNTGDVWLLGKHRLLCGDSTSEADVTRLMDGNLAQMVFTDPPYGVDYDGGHAVDGKRREKLANDGDPSIYEKSLPMMALASTIDASLYLWFAAGKVAAVTAAVTAAGYEMRNMLIWNKNLAQFWAIGAQYKQKFEPFFYCHKKGYSPFWSGPTNEVTVWDVNRESKNQYHPTQKPPELAERAMGNSCPVKGRVLDLFGGSGSSLIAAENTGRTAYLMELSPAYCDVIVARWEHLTGRKATRG